MRRSMRSPRRREAASECVSTPGRSGLRWRYRRAVAEVPVRGRTDPLRRQPADRVTARPAPAIPADDCDHGRGKRPGPVVKRPLRFVESAAGAAGNTRTPRHRKRDAMAMTTTASGLQLEDTKEGTG